MPFTRKKQNDPDITSAFREQLAVGENILRPQSASTDVIREQKKNAEATEIASYVNRYDFGLYSIDFVYSPLPGNYVAVPSTLEARIRLDKTEPLYFFMPYDLLPYINPGDFVCRYFPYIESTERMALCYRTLAESLVPYLPSFAALAADPELTARAYRDLKNEMNRIFGFDIFAPSGNGADYDETVIALRYARTVEWKSAVYSSADYNDFLLGNREKVLRMPSRYKLLPDYIRHIVFSSGTLPPEAIKTGNPEASSLSSMQAAVRKNSSLPLLVVSCLLCLPLFLLFYGVLYGAAAAVVSTGAVFFTGATLGGLSGVIPYVLVSAAVCSVSASRIVLRLFARRRYAAYRPYLRLLRRVPPHPIVKVTKKGVLVLSVLLVTLTACRGVFFQSDAILDRSGFFPFSGESYGYRDILSVTEYERSSGSFYYVMEFEGGGTLNLSRVMGPYDCERVAEKLVPLLEENGIEIEKAEKSDQ